MPERIDKSTVFYFENDSLINHGNLYLFINYKWNGAFN